MKQKKKAPSKQKGGTTPPKGGSTGNTSPTSPSPGLPSSSDAEKITNSSPSPDYTKSSSSEGTVPPSSSSPVPPESSPSHSPSSLTTPSPGAEEPQSRDTQSNQQLPLSSPAVSTPPSSSSSSSSSSSGTTTTVHASNTSSSSSSTESAPSSVPIHQEKEQDSSFLSPSSSPIPSSRMEEERNDSSSTINLKDPSDRENFNPVDKDTRSPDHDGDGNSSSSSLPPPSSAHTSTPKVSQGPSSSSASANTTASATPDKNDENPGDAEEEEDSSGHVSNDGIEKRPSPSRDTKSYQTLRSQRTIPKRQQSKYCREMIPRPHHLSTMKLPSSSAVSPGDLHKGKNGERKQENDEEEEGSTEEEEVKRGEKSVSPGGVAVRGDGEGDEGVGSAGEIGSSSAGTTAPTRGGSVVMNTDLGGFYQKLLGNNWRERLEDMNEEDFLGAFNEGGGEDPGEVGVGGVPGGDSAGMADSSMGGVGIGSGPSSSSADDDLNLPDTHHGKMRQRIRRRDVTVAKDISDQVADDLHLGEDDEPLITPEDIAEIRANAWTPAGEGLPVLSEIELGYHRAWDVGKKGCLAVKVDGIWDSAVKGNKMRFFVMDGTDTGENVRQR
ncbi:armadillo interacting protein [Cystoisospora suis]|uniref:Armadillo interacting protein n=1 Tax=Cystoisospora suis TaxID=483139 RepID=A0A2C6KRX7_9APIC|nr:armadillo interacting protein [Cystoisospora suis]